VTGSREPRRRSPYRSRCERRWIFSALEVAWDGPAADFFRRLASFSRLILFDKRGTGLSDRDTGIPDLETRMDDGPARAIRCASAITAAVGELGLEVRAGLHTGECELMNGKYGGIAVHIGARVAKQAEPGEVLVSSTVRDLVAGSGLRFRERGSAELKGVPGEWRLYAVER
jgi:class 3 adenylate cyclase